MAKEEEENMGGTFILVYVDADQKPAGAEAFNTEAEARAKADEASPDVDVWLVPVNTGKAILLRER